MAIGDNIPKIFGNLAETSMKSMGDFQYHLDLLNNLDAEEEMALRNAAMSFGPPAPMDGPMVDQFLLMSGGDPMAATDMTLKESIMENAPDNTELNKNEFAAQALYDYSPGPIDPILLNTFADNMDITPSDLQIGYDKVDAITQFNMLNDFAITSGENLIQAIPGSPDDEPPPGRGPIDDNERSPIGDDPPPFEPDSSDYNTSLFGLPLLTTNIESGIDPTYFPNKELLGSGLGALGKGIGRGLGKLFPGLPDTQPPSAEQVEGFVDNWAYMEKPELDAAINQQILQDYSPDSIKLLEEGDPITVSNFNKEKEIIKDMYPVDLTEDDEVTISDMVASPTDEEKRPFLGSGDATYNPVPFGPDELSRRSVGSVGPQVSATYDPNSLPATFTDLDPSQQWGPYMQQTLPNYYAPGVQDAYSRAYQPFLGTYLLSPDIGGFASFMHEYKPEQFPQFDWNAFDPQWSQVLDYAEGQQGSDVATVQGSSRDLAEINSKLFTALTGSDAPNNAIALAMSRYNEGNIVEPSYGNKLLQESLTTMYNRQQREDLYKGDTNTTANFLASLAEMNPERFGR